MTFPLSGWEPSVFLFLFFGGSETGKRNIPNEILIKFAKLYNTSTDYILGLTDEKKPYKKTERK